MRAIRPALAIAGLLLAVTASAQQGPAREITFYSEPDYRGDRLTLTQARDRIQLGWQIRSLRMPEGDRWLVCPRIKFQGNCEVMFKSEPSTRMFVGSARPRKRSDLPAPPPRPIEAAADAGTSPGPSLRGTNAEFFAAPMIGGQRAPSCESGGNDCTEEAADRFCQAQGWPGSAYQRSEAVEGRNYLVDVLCTRRGD
jgi:hypothetical protein